MALTAHSPLITTEMLYQSLKRGCAPGARKVHSPCILTGAQTLRWEGNLSAPPMVSEQLPSEAAISGLAEKYAGEFSQRNRLACPQLYANPSRADAISRVIKSPRPPGEPVGRGDALTHVLCWCKAPRSRAAHGFEQRLACPGILRPCPQALTSGLIFP